MLQTERHFEKPSGPQDGVKDEMKTLKPRKTQVKRRQTAYEARKEVKRSLVAQVKDMQNELDQLKFRLLVEQGEADKETKRTKADNKMLREFVHRQHLVRAGMHAALTSHAQRSLNTLQPVQSVISLGTDQVARYNTLMALKERQLDYTERYLAARSHGLNPRSTYCQEERFDSPEGAYFVLRFEILPIQGAHVKEVFDTILGSVLNAEIILSEMFGCVAIREDNDFETSEFSQLRLVTATSAGTTVESNTIMFSRFSDESNDECGHGVMAADFVDFDALYPYRTGERVRRDTTTLVTARSLYSNDSESPEVVVHRWSSLKVHRELSRDPETEMAESSVCYGDTAQKFIQQQLVHAKTQTIR
ncbi:hypothetical protein L914_17222 [Phytophthora nicotianae]|uniref:Uncharacterized protein n=1 Tax=Phytophthora nicotianae TaxID=4792 RepID=W2MI19_PHYNI|nr:hypothetical protein L914_17222 [Phytophthora nicotianae]